MNDRSGDDRAVVGAVTTMLLVEESAREVRRAVGPLAWCCLEELSLAARQTPDGWMAPVGVRALGSSLGVTKDTAARALQVLIAAGLVARRGSASSAEYALCPPPGLGICLNHQDIGRCPTRDDASVADRSMSRCRTEDDACHTCEVFRPAPGSPVDPLVVVSPAAAPRAPARRPKTASSRRSNEPMPNCGAAQGSLFTLADEESSTCTQSASATEDPTFSPSH